MGRFSTFWAVCAIAVGVAGCSPSIPESPPVRQVVQEPPPGRQGVEGKTLAEFRAETEDVLGEEWDVFYTVTPEKCDYVIEQVKRAVRVRDAKGSLEDAVAEMASLPVPSATVIAERRLARHPILVEAAKTRGYDLRAMLMARVEALIDPAPPS